MIYEVNITATVDIIVNRSPYFSTNDPISYEITNEGLNVVRKHPYNKTTCDEALKNHKSRIKEAAAENVTISEEFNSYLIKPDGITVLR